MKKRKYRFKLMNWVQDLFPYCRSLTGEGNRKTLKYIKNILQELKIHSVPALLHAIKFLGDLNVVGFATFCNISGSLFLNPPL